MGRNQRNEHEKANAVTVIPKTTLFIRNLPYTVTNESLLDAFKAYGPIQTAFVVTDSISKESRGIGYVRYTDKDDAVQALKSVKQIEGRKVFVSYADSKAKTTTAKGKEDTKKPKPAVASSAHRLVVRNLPFSASEEKLKNFFANAGDVTAVEIPKNIDGRPRGFGFVMVNDKEVGEKAISTLDQQVFGERKISVEWFVTDSEFNKSKKKLKNVQKPVVVKPTPSGQKPVVVKPTPSVPKVVTGENGKLIIRNLPFTITKAELEKTLSSFGEVIRVDIPRKHSKKIGFAFVTFRAKEAAEKALSELKLVSNRQVAVDWAVDKSTYANKTAKGTESSDVAKPDTTSDSGHITADTKSKNKPKLPNANTSKKDSEAKSINSKQNNNKVQSHLSDVDSESGSEDDLDHESGSEDDLDTQSGSENGLDSESGSEVDVDDDSASEEENSGSEADSEADSSYDSDTDKNTKSTKVSADRKSKPFQTSSADISQERTLFLRNVGYDTTEDQLLEVFKQFGDVMYVKVLVDPMTERSKGMAFVQYSKRTEAEKCLEASQDPQQRSMFFVDGRDLNVALAISREKVSEISKAKEKQPKDKRNLYLAREGLIRDGTQAAEGVSRTDINKRMKLETTMRAKLKNPLIFISPVRLCVHNLPTKLSDRQLRAICLKGAAQGKAAKITECRIMRDMTHVNAEGVAKSRGYGFVAFSEHQHALAALRNLNNSPEIFTNEKRPIVEFSLENTKALQAKEKRLQSAKSILSGKAKNNPDKEKLTKISTKGTDSKIERPKGVKPGLPSHHGPKVRHSPRPSTALDPKQQAKVVKKRKVKEISRREKEENKQPKQKKKRLDQPDAFDKLVNSYRSKLSATDISTKAKSKWYQ